MTKEQLIALPDDVRIPTEILLTHLERLKFRPKSIATTDEGGIGFFWEAPVDMFVITADIEIEVDGTTSASVIPYIKTPEGHVLYDGELEMIEVWEVEEEAPFEETIDRIMSRLHHGAPC